MKRQPIPTGLVMVILLPVLISCDACILYRYHSKECKQRGAAYAARVEKLKSDAHEKLRVGTTKQDVIRFFKENGLPVDFVSVPYESSVYEATGTIYTTGCAPSGCGTDDALLGLKVKVDKAGMVMSEPVVGAIYTNCL